MRANRRCWWLGVGGTAIVWLACGGGPKAPPQPAARDGALTDGAGMGADGSGVGRRAQMLVATSDARGQVRLGASAADYAELLLLDSETQRPVGEARMEALPEEEGGDGYLVRVTKESRGYRPELVRVPARASSARCPGGDDPGHARARGPGEPAGLLARTSGRGRPGRRLRLASRRTARRSCSCPVLDAATMRARASPSTARPCRARCWP